MDRAEWSHAARHRGCRGSCRAGAQRNRRLDSRRLQALAGQTRRPDHQPHGPRPKGSLNGGHSRRGPIGEPGRAVRTRTRHPRGQGRAHRGRQGREDRPARVLPLQSRLGRSTLPPHCRTTQGRRGVGVRHPRCGRTFLYLHRDDGLRHGRGGQARHRGDRARPAQPHHGHTGGGPRLGPGASRADGLSRSAHAARNDRG